MKHSSYIWIIIACLCVSVNAFAVPAKKGIRVYQQPDGTTVDVILNGDEQFHYYTTSDGVPLVEDADGALYFGTLNGLNVQKTRYLACNADQRTAEIQSLINSAAPEAVISVLKSRADKKNRRLAGYNGLGRFETTFPNKGELKALVILVEYSDVRFTLDDPKRYFTDLLNKDGFDEYKATGCAREYFLAASNGQFDLHSDVYGPVTLPRTRNYYGGNDMFGSDSNPEDMVVHAIELLKGKVDFSQYDCDKDGILDNVFVFYAGKGEASGGPASSVWPHAWNLTQAGKSFTVDGVLVDHYACTNEWQGDNPDGIGTFCHEFSHIMGLPDLYCTDGSGSNFTPGEWSVMDYGPYNNNSRTPPTYSAYERNAMGWLDIVEVNEGGSHRLDDLKDSNKAVLIPTSRSNEFFLFENRQQTSWDKYLPHHGMLIWHVDFDKDVWRKNIVNNDQDHQHVDLIEANGVGESKNGASWPGIHEKTSFTAQSDPSFVDWKGRDIGLPITGIVEENGVIYFDVDGGEFELAAPQNLAISEITPISLRADWTPVERAKGYIVSVYANRGVVRDFVPGFTAAKTNATTTFIIVEGLDAETEYTVEVSAFYGSRVSPASSINVNTPEMTFPYITPVVLPAENISNDSFTASWLPVEGAEHYLLTVESAYEILPETSVCNFGSLIFRVPTGWDFSLKTSRYSDANWCGKAVPSAKMDKDGATLTSPVFDCDIVECSLWTKLTSRQSESILKVEGFTDGEWQKIESIENIPASGTTHRISSIPAGTRQLKFTFIQDGGANLALDDVEITTGGVARSVLENYNGLNVGATTSFVVDNLPAGETGFYYKVKAVTSDGDMSLFSKDQYVDWHSSSIQDNILENTVRGVDIDIAGNIYCQGLHSEEVSVYTIDGIKRCSSIIGEDGKCIIALPKGAVYIIRVGYECFKISI